MGKLKPGVPCDHPGCLSHISHPCEGCGRIAGNEKVNEITREDILKGPYFSNPNVHVAISLWSRGGCTWEQAMMHCVISLVGQVELLEDRVRDKIAKEPEPNWHAINSLLGRK